MVCARTANSRIREEDRMRRRRSGEWYGSGLIRQVGVGEWHLETVLS